LRKRKIGRGGKKRTIERERSCPHIKTGGRLGQDRAQDIRMKAGGEGRGRGTVKLKEGYEKV